MSLADVPEMLVNLSVVRGPPNWDSVHLTPFQCSASALSVLSPTAHTSVADTASSAVRWMVSCDGKLTTLQADPFQCSRNDPSGPVSWLNEVSYSPASHTSPGLIAATASGSAQSARVSPLSVLSLTGSRPGLGVHGVPFQCATSGLPASRP